MKDLSFRDMKQLCAYLDGQLSQSRRARLEKRIKSDPALAAALEEICDTCKLLRSMPQKRAPRNFTLSPRMAGVRAPVPRLVPVLSWASAAAMLLFIFTLGVNLVGKLSFGAAAPMLEAAPSGIGGGPVAATEAPAVAAAPATEAPAQLRSDQNMKATPTAEAFIMSVPEATASAITTDNQPPPALKAQHKPLNPWLVVWAGLGLLLGALALLVWWLNRRAFRRKNLRK